MEAGLWKIKQELCDIGKRIWQRGYCAGNEGNHSVRVDDKHVLCTPTGISKGFLTPEMICLVDMEGKHLNRNSKYKPTSEVLIHLEIYKERDDIKAVIHSHPVHATAFALVGMPIPEGMHPEAEVFLGRIPMAQFAMPSKIELAESIKPFIKEDTHAIVMGNHGVVCFSDTLESAYYRLEILDSYCHTLLLTKNLGRPNQLTNAQMKELLEVKASFGERDHRLACAAEGCPDDQSEPFLQSFENSPSVISQRNGAPTIKSTGTDSDKTQIPQLDPQAMESLVQTITDQILARIKQSK